MSPRKTVVAKTVFLAFDIDEASSSYRSFGFEVEGIGGSAYAWVTGSHFNTQDAADWHPAWVASGIDVGPIEDHPWQMLEFSLRDPSDTLLRVGPSFSVIRL